LPVAEEARVTAEAWHCAVSMLADVGVAGLHRLLQRLDALGGADAVVVVAGMEGALPSVVGGLVEWPVIAVPTSVGYGASFGGLAGAAALVGAAALRSGAGLVRIACPAEIQPTVASFEPSYMTYPLENDADGLIRYKPARRVLGRLLERADVLAMGPGLGQSS